MIDDAIVVLENIYRFIEEKHVDQYTAAVEATREIGLAVLATTLSLVAIFVPVGFMGGIVGRFMKSFGLTMAFAIMVSLLVSFTLTPMMAARWLKVDPHGKDKHSSKDSRIFHALDALYTRLLEWSMAHRALMAGFAVLVLLSSVPLFMFADKNFMPNDDQAEFEINLRAPEGTSLESTEVITNRIATAVRRRYPGSGIHARHHRRRSVSHQEPGEHLHPPDADRASLTRSVRHHGRHPQPGTAAACRPTFARRCSRWRSSVAAARRTPTSNFSSTDPT